MTEKLNKLLSQGFTLVDELKLNEALLLSDELLLNYDSGPDRGNVLMLKGEALLYSGHYSLAAACFFEGVKLAEAFNYQPLLAASCCGLSYVYRFLEDYRTAIDYAQKCMQLLGVNRDKVFLKALLSEGISKARSGNIEEADLLLKQALYLSEELKEEFLIITCQKCLADFYLNIHDYTHAIRMYDEALSPSTKSAHYILKTMILVRQAEAVDLNGDPERGLAICNEGLMMAEKNEFIAGQKSAHSLLSRLFEKRGDNEAAFKHLRLFLQLQNNANTHGQTQSINKMELSFIKERLDKEIYLLAQLKEKHQSLTASIDYAKGLQEAILPVSESLQDPFLDYFVFFKPKEKVGGDFYAIERFENGFLFCVADCTGHGVPGAMLSLLSSELVNQAIKANQKLGLHMVLQTINRSLHTIFGNAKNLVTANDGMDISFCAIEKNKNNGEFVLRFSGANHSCILIRDQEVVQTAYNRTGISLLTPVDYNFIETNYPLKKGDRLYLFTDGYPDQFGGNDETSRKAGGKKFKHRQLIELFQKASKLNVSDQKTLLAQTLESWMGELEQIDDICVLGIHFKGQD